MKKIYISFLIVCSLGCLFFSRPVQAASLSGRIFLQVQDKGQAWYVYPVDAKRYYLGRPEDAFNIMRKLGLGISEKDFFAAAIRPPKNIMGRIILRVQDKGQAYYVNPLNGRLNYLGRPFDAFQVIRSLGEGITNSDLNTIVLGYLDSASNVSPIPVSQLGPDQRAVKFSWKYDGKDYYLNRIFSKALYERYSAMPRVLTYQQNNAPANLRDSFYAMFLASRSGDNTLDLVIEDLKKIAQDNEITGDRFVEFIMAFVQYIPYDTSKLNNDNQPNYIYETLYRNLGVCSDKSFLAVAILRQLGYGAAILDYPDSKHSATGVACPKDKSTGGSGYCFMETTNFFPIGVIPNTLKSGQAENSGQFDNIFSDDHLGTLEIYQKSSANVYSGIVQTMAKVDLIKKLAQTIRTSEADLGAISLELASEREVLDAMLLTLSNYKASGNISGYNQLTPQYNTAANSYNEKAANYQLKVDIYNATVQEYNNLTRAFYQQS